MSGCPRFKALLWAYEQFNRRLLPFQAGDRQGLLQLSEEGILTAACSIMRITWYSRNQPAVFPILYQNEGFVVYALASVKHCGVAAIPQN